VAEPVVQATPPPCRRILHTRVDATSYRHATDQVLGWAAAGQSRYVCVATVNNLIEGCDDPGYNGMMEAADLVTPDGMPLVWGLRLLGVPDASRVYGPDLTLLVCEEAARQGIPVGFYGGHDDVLDDLTAALGRRWPELRVAYRWSPPFRALTDEEEARVDDELLRSGARVLFVGLGSPKQERWMADRRHLPMVMIGVGAAFDFLSGRKRQAPRALQGLGLEWLYRLAHEPRRLWRRYLYLNPMFLALLASQALRLRRFDPADTVAPTEELNYG
jgi:N-acetylglucosaminyldiphosphoundecaprenol N-acetyl-beta-D-mannosaminyltransferase